MKFIQSHFSRTTILFMFFFIATSLTLSETTLKNPIFSNLGKAKLQPSFEMKGYWVWGSSIIKSEDNLYHMYVSRWPDSLLFHPGWMIASEIVHAVSEKPEGPYRFSDIALTTRGAQYWDGRSVHNPRILRYKNKWVLYYMGSTHPFEGPNSKNLSLTSKWCIVGRSNKRIGVAIADSPYGPWKRFDTPVLETRPNTFYSFLTSNPSPVINEDGSVLLIFKARSYIGNDNYSGMCFGLAKAKSIYDKFTVLNNNQPVFGGEGQPEIEDPFFWKDAKGFHLIFKDHVGKITGEKQAGASASSVDAIHWIIDSVPKAYSKTIEWENGLIQKMGLLERPFLLFENNKPAFLFFATMDGPGVVEKATKSWNMVIPLRIK